MATPEYKALDQLRTRLSQLSASINLLRHDLESSQPLPSWPQLQTASINLASSLQSLAVALSSQRALLSSAHAYPLPTFPGSTQENTLQQLLRKKLDPKAEDWIDRELDKQPPTHADRKELWDWANEFVEDLRATLEAEREEGEGYLVPKLGIWGDYFSIEERDNELDKVQTGVRRKLWEEDDGEDVVMRDANQGKKTGVAPLPLESLLRFSTGAGLPQMAGRV